MLILSNIKPLYYENGSGLIIVTDFHNVLRLVDNCVVTISLYEH